MLEKIIIFLKRIFNYNSTKYLPEISFAGLTGGYEVEKNFHVVNFENNNLKIEEIKMSEEKLDDVDLVSYVFDKDETKEKEVTAEEDDFEYDINKVEEMNKKIDYYKKNTDKLYLLELKEILELNFYYKKRVEKLENK